MWVQFFTSPLVTVTPVNSLHLARSYFFIRINEFTQNLMKSLFFVLGTHFVIVQSNNSWVWIFKHFQRTNTRFLQQDLTWNSQLRVGYLIHSLIFCGNCDYGSKLILWFFTKPLPTHNGSIYVWALSLKEDGFLLFLTSLMGFDLQTKPITQ